MTASIPHSLGVLLAQRQSALTHEQSRDVIEGLIWLVAAAVVLGVVFWIIRKRYGRETDASETLGFTLADMRRLHAAGELSDAEFEQAKRQMLAQGRRLMAPEAESDAAETPASPEAGSLGTAGNPVDNTEGFDASSDKIVWEPDRPDQG